MGQGVRRFGKKLVVSKVRGQNVNPCGTTTYGAPLVPVPKMLYITCAARTKRQTQMNLSENNVHEIRSRIKTGGSQVEIARKFGVSPATISDIKKGRSWGWLDEREDEGELEPLIKSANAEREDWWPSAVTVIEEKLDMTRKHYVAIARIVEKNNLGNSHLVDDLAMMFLADNSEFDPQKFLAACGREVNPPSI